MAAEPNWREAFKEGQLTSNHDETVDSFDAMNLRSELLRGVYAYGFEQPSAVQQRAITPMINGNDVIVQAQLDNDGLATLSIPVLQNINSDDATCQALILAPTRDIARQIHNITTGIATFTQTKCQACVNNIEAPHDGSQVVVSTPGRIYAWIRRGMLNTEGIKTIVLNDADEILARDPEHVEEVLKLFPRSTSIVLFSTTKSQDVLNLALKFMRDPVRIVNKKAQFTLGGITQFYVTIKEEDQKLDIFVNFLREMTPLTQIIIFCRLRRTVEWLAEELTTRDFVLTAMHGDMDAWYRADLMKTFRAGDCRILIATDLLARGIDVQQVPLVINYDLPDTCEKYRHRIGYGGPSGRKGITVSFVAADEVGMISDIEEFYGTQVTEIPPESVTDVVKHALPRPAS